MQQTLEKCPTCGHSLDDPYRRRVNGTITEGCIDKCHDKHLIPTTANYNWVMACRKKNKQYKRQNA